MNSEHSGDEAGREGMCAASLPQSAPDNPPAFPRVESVTDPNRTWAGSAYRYPVTSSEGMSLRDWYAGQALSGITCNEHYDTLSFTLAARDAYLYADAMLKART